MSLGIHFNRERHTGPCLRGCGQAATYQLINPETERYRANCPNCGEYGVGTDDVDNACNIEEESI
jgi:hypothetical protein